MFRGWVGRSLPCASVGVGWLAVPVMACGQRWMVVYPDPVTCGDDVMSMGGMWSALDGVVLFRACIILFRGWVGRSLPVPVLAWSQRSCSMM